MEDLEERMRSFAEPVLARYGAELVDLEVKRGPTSIVRVIADRPDGIDLDTCARVSEELSRMLDLEDPIQERYTLEVSSPGLNRPLRTPEDFRRNIGRRVKIVLANSQHEGLIEEVGGESVTIRPVPPKGKPTGATPRPGEPVEVPLDQIAKATIVLPW